ncbi:hypothetical protein ABKS89_11555 [Pseudomonas sp. LABIM340]|uniref:hypothetical protein n=1 Tax=Pseudomonas sp. LABIM340 TaxID=3156585 RepID=UPI0032AEDACB
MDALNEYYQALERLVNNTPLRLDRGSKISKDTVALEAGRGRGSIKKSRVQFFDLIEAIQLAASNQRSTTAPGEELRELVNQYRDLYEAALVREVSLLSELTKCKADLAKARSAGVKRVK